MNAKVRLLGAFGVLVGLVFLPQRQTTAQETTTTRVAALEVQTRGPVHEAFAQPLDLNPRPEPIVPKEPPRPVPETPPEERPPGDNVQWIGGYWSWDAERNDFVWITGTYRNVPPGRHFLPGQWVHMADGWQWVQGMWAPDNQSDVRRTAAQPPAPLETEPSVAPPDDNSTYVPGYWYYNDDGTFAWRSGYYTQARQGWVWVPPHYVYTPSGYIFVSGYWDYPLEDRGMLFAPMWFNEPLWQTPGWTYQPAYAVAAPALVDTLFARGPWFYFGNYYGAAYGRRGYRPWYANRYDPLFGYYRWANRRNPSWALAQQRVFNDRTSGRIAGPPRTFAQQTPANRVVTPLSVSTSQVQRSISPHIATPSSGTTTATTTRPTGRSTIRGMPELRGWEGRVPPHHGIVVGGSQPQAPSSVVRSPGQPRIVAGTSSSVPRVLHPTGTSSGVPRVYSSSGAAPHASTAPASVPRAITIAPPAARSSAPQAYAHTPVVHPPVAHAPAPHPSVVHRATPSAHASRPVVHAPAHGHSGRH